MDEKATVKETLKEILVKLELEAEMEMSEKDGAIWVKLDTAEPGVLIGRHGRNLESLQVYVSQVVAKKLGVWARLVLTVGDYRERREQQLIELANSAAEQVLNTAKPVVLSELTPAERRIVHLALADRSDLQTESTGEGRFRILTVKLKTPNA